jgi:hypothetical protein
MSPPDEHVPEQSSDDTDEGWSEPQRSEDDDVRRWLDERPPHHLDRE